MRVGTHVYAAGAVVWRIGSTLSSLELALIHRPRYDDWSLPKGKLAPGETAVMAAVREITEETAVTVQLRRYLSRMTYPISGNRHKVVDYWSAEATAGQEIPFSPGEEVDILQWLPVDSARDRLTYPADRDVVDEFRRHPVNTHTILIVRHAKAGKRGHFTPGDERRPLDSEGRAQAMTLVPNLLAFGPHSVHSADPLRCVQTVTPLSESLGTEIIIEPALSEAAYALDPDAAVERIRTICRLDGIRAVCSQGKVIPGLIGALARSDAAPLPRAANRKGSFWVLSIHEGRVIAADHVDSPR